MDIFYYELMFWLLILAGMVITAIAAWFCIKLIWAISTVIYERTVRHITKRAERKERREEYRRRSAEYRRECLRCYRAE